MRRYRSADEDSARWASVPLRPGDVIVSSRSKHGTTWVQAVLLTMVHGPALPDRLDALSPWVDHLVEPIDSVADRLAAQPHRRVVKSHTPLDGLPDDPRIHRVVVARHPLDAAVSLYHQRRNIDRVRLAELTGAAPRAASDEPLATWLSRWVHADPDPVEALDSLPGVLHHLADAWRRRDDPGVVLVHYADLAADPAAEVRRLAAALDLAPAADIDAVVRATSFAAMRSRAEDLAPDSLGVLADRGAFFRAGRSGEGAAALAPSDLAAYEARVAQALDPTLRRWLHR
ncbi:sulfotransferase domain-containing protein [Euzebya sp.]|uniref:sulfotransferase domain-containing protein n=1 Tax=Euzebya sp. TaxID=1971409 RepID=UPI003512D012